MTTRNLATFVFPAALSIAIAQAAEPVQWTNLPAKVGGGAVKDRQYRVVTKTGQTYTSHELVFRPDAVNVGGHSIRREQVAEIRLHRDRRLSEALLAPANAMMDHTFGKCTDDSCLPLLVVAIPVWLAAIPATAPVVLPIEGIKRLVPDKVIKVAQ